jgi:hypothetical protein
VSEHYVSIEDVVGILEDAVERLREEGSTEFAEDADKIVTALPVIRSLPEPYWQASGEEVSSGMNSPTTVATNSPTTTPGLYLRWYVQYLLAERDRYRKDHDEYGADLYAPDGHETEIQVVVGDRTFTVKINIEEGFRT